MREVRVSDDRAEVYLSPATYRAALALLRWTHEEVAVRIMRLTARPLGPTDLRAYANGGSDLPGWIVGAILAALLPFVEFTCANGEVGVVLKRKVESDAVTCLVNELAAPFTDWPLKGATVDWEGRRVR